MGYTGVATFNGVPGVSRLAQFPRCGLFRVHALFGRLAQLFLEVDSVFFASYVSSRRGVIQIRMKAQHKGRGLPTLIAHSQVLLLRHGGPVLRHVDLVIAVRKAGRYGDVELVKSDETTGQSGVRQRRVR